ncbi:unnamed protein product [Schistosoma mattheei]|uniref:Uncharacterized protein n=1 Tax=Schistosoma mattheei TaxID=31246 RepID=A0A183P2D3_9TREM|nr:unnamed protein product [Schistosoma mattheei]
MDGQAKTLHQLMKSLGIGLSRVSRCRLPSRGPRDYRNQWLEILNDIFQNHFHWPSCIHSLFFPRFYASEFLLIVFYFFNLYFLESYFQSLIFLITTDAVTTFTILGFGLIIPSLY